MAGEEWAAVQDRLMASYDEVRDELLGIPGVVEVGVGLRRRAGRIEDEAVYVVSVRTKLPAAEVPAGELIPDSIRGVPIDVEEYTEPIPLLGFGDEDDKRNYGTKVGGVSIRAEGAGGHGTLGCFCKRNDDNSVVLLSCHHVLFDGNAEEDSGVGQPRYDASCCCTCNEMGKVLKGDKNVDCAIASVKSDVKFFPKIRRIKRSDGTVEEEGLILGVAAPVLAQIVWKVGKTTGLTRGKVTKFAPRIEIEVEPPFSTFAKPGDSGSVVVEKATGMVVGLLRAITTSDGKTGIMRRMADVLAVLNISLIPSDPNAVYTEAYDEDGEELFPLPAASPFDSLVGRLRDDEAGRTLLRIADRHVQECLALVNRRREFTVAWHRSRGPAWLASLGRSARDPIYRIPEQIDGVERAEALRRIELALAAEASDDLRADLAEFGPSLAAAFGAGSSVDDILGRLRIPASAR
ncbi:hypothetical protein EV646_113186 [Kribbella antiqua]|uniref:Trypsin-like peptidase n=1 Tax=Kribbella antiqua TaxID=2512217 RepID=A0A4R2IDA6_9ACTN|nr:hypothetical protein [Kribbella antiqua]TCO42564.1 hypothetical protein EV646_113186 [Kribbella antiqua]